MTNPFRNLPAVDAVLGHPVVVALRGTLPVAQVTDCARAVIEATRQTLKEHGGDAAVSLEEIAQRTAAAATRLTQRRLVHVINATGIVLHTNLGRAALSQTAIERLQQAAGATNLELSLDTGQRSRRGAYAEDLLTRLTQAEAALVVNNCAAATMLALQGVAGGREVVISRGQLVEIGGGFRLPEVFEAAGVTLREVGTANRTSVADYENAINESTAAILRVHRSNFRVSGFVSEPSAAELVAVAQQHNLVMIDDLGSGCLTSLQPLGLDEPDVASSLKADSDLLLFSGDKLLGGPQAGILIGKSAWVERLRKHPMSRATRVCKLTLSALEATLEEHLAGRAYETVPALRMLSISADEVRARCEAVVTAVGDIGLELSVVASQAEVGGGSLADQGIESFAVKVQGLRADDVAQSLRTRAAGPILARIEDGAVLLDLRTVAPEGDADVIEALKSLPELLSGSAS